MPFRAADRMTVANPTEPQMPTAISAALTKAGSPSHEIGPTWTMPRIAFSRPIFASGA